MHALRRHPRFLATHAFDEEGRRRHAVVKSLVVGGALVIFGIAWLLQAWHVAGIDTVWLAWPVILAWSGGVRLAFDRSALSVVRALVRFALAAYLVVVIENIGGLTWATTWPILAIGAGIAVVADALFALARGRAGAGRENSW